tara:strand:+ start:243 stop:467 length:225 start_codon:yes stop_codon:yes gene_type:complete
VATIARLTSWSLDFILWELPYAAGLQLYHAEYQHNGQAVRLVNAPAEHETRRGDGASVGMREQFSMMKSLKEKG